MSETIASIVQWAIPDLSEVTDVQQLEAEVLLAYVLQTSRSHIHAHPEKLLTEKEEHDFRNIVERRAQGEPIAYITGHKEFWSLDLTVTPDTLIPRPETETLVELTLKKISGENKIIADLGTGSGAIALAIAHEKPSWIIHATDRSSAALEIAKLNAGRLKIKNVIFHHGIWCEALPKIEFDAIVSNPPYISEEEKYPQFEPQSALIAKDQGLSDIRDIVNEAKNYLKPGGLLLIEHGAKQGAQVKKLFMEADYMNVSSYQDMAKLDRVMVGNV